MLMMLLNYATKSASLVLSDPAFTVTATATTTAAGVMAASSVPSTLGGVDGFGGGITADTNFMRNYYVEFTLTAMGAGKNIAVGCKIAAASLTTKPGAAATSFGYDASVNKTQLNGATAVATGWPVPVQGDVIGLKLDEFTGMATWYLNGGSPVTIGPITTSTYHYPAIYLYDSGDSVTMNCGGGDGMTFSYLPANTFGWNYVAWPGWSRFSMLSMSDKTASNTLSNYSLSVTATAVGTAAGVRCAISSGVKSPNVTYGGSRYCEFTLNTMSASSITIGLSTSAAAVNTKPGNVALSAGYDVSTNLVKADNGTGLSTGWTTPVAGDVIGISVDCITGSVLFYKNGVAASNTVILGTSANYFPHIYLFTNLDKVTFNAGGPTGLGFSFPPASVLGWNHEHRETRLAPKRVQYQHPIHRIGL